MIRVLSSLHRMHLQRIKPSLNASSRLITKSYLNRQSLLRRSITTQSPGYQSKYADKLKERAEKSGLSVSQLIEKANAEKADQRKAEAEKLRQATEKLKSKIVAGEREGETLPSQTPKASPKPSARKDAPPYKALSSILNLPRLLSTPHTPEQISGLWTAYHASRSEGTGRGFVCASVPLALYEKMATNGRTYPSFVVPVPRIQLDDPTTPKVEEENVAHEFYYLQWDFHAPPPVPAASVEEELFAKPPAATTADTPNPQTSTVLFAPLQEYKLRQSFATPYLVLTMYTDLAATHGIVLLRGEITPGAAASGGSADRFMLSQEDAQLLTMALQKFYLWAEESGRDSGVAGGKELLRTFHEKPQEFKWEDLLAFSKLTV